VGRDLGRHNPPPYFTSLSTCSANDVPYTQLATDLADNALPAFSFVTPNLIDDMHDGTIADGNSWLSSSLPTIVISPSTPAGATSATLFSHYSLLATAEQLLGLPALGQAASAATMAAAFNL
jgi:phosphatidylinositol-3-phosphatase